MRRLTFALCCLFFAAGAHAQNAPNAPSVSPAQNACDPARIGARELADCLRAASEKSDRELAAALEGAQKSIDSKPKMLATRKARWKRFLADSETQWLSWRDSECQDLAPLEASVNGAGGDPKLSCIIDFNTRRAADLKARYP